jgi:hypothetical protein
MKAGGANMAFRRWNESSRQEERGAKESHKHKKKKLKSVI